MFKLEFETDNAAFEDFEGEVSRIVQDVARCVEAGRRRGKVSDANGNAVGKWELTGEPEVE